MYEEIKQNVTMHDLLAYYGFKAKNKRIPCPIHNGKHYNLSFNDNVFHCFKCGAKGSVIDFVCQYEGLSAIDAAHHLNSIFYLGLTNTKPSEFEILKYKIKRLTRELGAAIEAEQYYFVYARLFKQKKKEYKSAQNEVIKLEKDLAYYKEKLFVRYNSDINIFYESEVSSVVKRWQDRTYDTTGEAEKA